MRPAPGADARAKLLRHALRGKEVAIRYAAELGALAVPETNAGGQAKQLLGIAATDSIEWLADEERRVLGLPKNITFVQSARQLEQLELAFIRAFSEMTVPPTHIAALIPDYKDAFESTDACKELGAMGAS